MSSIDSGLSDLFPCVNHAKMGNGRVSSNDDLADLFKQVQPLSSIDADIVRTGAENGEVFGLNESEITTNGIFDLLEDSCFKEPPNFSSLLTLDSADDLLLNGEPLKLRSSSEPIGQSGTVTHKNGNELVDNTAFPGVGKDSEHPDSCIDKIVDILATFVNESPHGELNFNSDILDPSRKYLPSEMEFTNEIMGEGLVESTRVQLSDPSDETVPEEHYLFDDAPNSTVEDILMKVISLSNLEMEEDACVSDGILNNVHLETDVLTVSQSTANVELPPQQEPKSSERLLLPSLTEFSCNSCYPKIFFVSKTDFLEHKLNHRIKASKKQTIECKICSLTFSQSRVFLNHIRKHQKRKCEICLKEIPTVSFKNHLATHYKSLRLLCEYCGLDFVSKMKLKEHLSLHENRKLYVCELCDQSFSNHGSFWIHKKWHESPFPYKCACGLSFRHSSVLAKHRRQKSCAKTSTSNLSIEKCLTFSKSEGNHMTSNNSIGKLVTTSNSTGRFTSKSLPYTDSPGSKENLPSISFANNSENNNQPLSETVGSKLKIAVSRHPKKKNKCEFCDREFPTTTSLAIHRLKHTKERPYQCQRCLKSFAIANSLLKHKNSIVACDRELKKRAGQKSAPINVPALKILPKLDLDKFHCPHCNIHFPSFDSFAIHFSKKFSKQETAHQNR